MKNVFLEHNFRYRWHTKIGVSFKGFAFDSNNELCATEQILEMFENSYGIEEIEGAISGLDGSFSVIRETPDGLFLATDFLNTFPVFYTWQDGNWYISDNSYKLLEILKEKKCNHNAFAEFSGAGFVLGNQTLICGILKTQSAEIVLLKPDGSHTSRVYSRWLPKGVLHKSREELKEMLANVLGEVADNFIQSLQGKHVVVPLSGGFDSRLIACILHSKGYKNVTCLTYGRPSKESYLAEKVAKQLGYKWIFVNYEEIDIEGFLESATFNDYYKYAANHYSMPYLQDYFAVKHLKDNNLIPSDSVFVPGHSGDFLAGSYINKTARTKTNYELLPKYIFEKYFKFGSYNLEGRKQVIARLKMWFDENPLNSFIQHPEVNFKIEEWDIKEKLSKFIFQSVQVFPYFGYDFRLPLWSKPLRDFFREVPVEFREQKNLYDEVLKEKYFMPNGVFFATDEIKSANSSPYLSKIKTFLKSIAPQFLLDHRIKANDVICYQRLTEPMKQEIKGKLDYGTRKTFCFNNIICKWYIERVCKEMHKNMDIKDHN